MLWSTAEMSQRRNQGAVHTTSTTRRQNIETTVLYCTCYISSICRLILPYSRSCVNHTVDTSNPATRHDNKSLWRDCLYQDGLSCTGSPEVLKKTYGATEKPICFPSPPKLVARVDIANQAEDNSFNDHIDDSDEL